MPESLDIVEVNAEMYEKSSPNGSRTLATNVAKQSLLRSFSIDMSSAVACVSVEAS